MPQTNSASIRNIKATSREDLLGRYAKPMGAMLLSALLPGIISYIFSVVNPVGKDAVIAQYIVDFVVTVIVTMLTRTLEAGVYKIHLAIIRGKDYAVKDMFNVFKERPDRFLGVSFLLYLLTVVPVMPGIELFRFYRQEIFDDGDVNTLLIAVGAMLVGLVIAIYFTLRYSLVLFILTDDLEIGIIDAMKRSALLMRGLYFKRLGLELSFIGMIMLEIISLGIGSLWVTPYMNQAYTRFYLMASDR